MLRILRNIFIFLAVTTVISAVVKFVILNRITPEQRAKLQERIDSAVEAGKEAAAHRREKLEDRLNELVTNNNN